MKKTIQTLILTLIFSTSIYGQSTERFIRIIGNAKKEIKADKAKVYFTISESKATKYSKNKEDITYEDAYKEVYGEKYTPKALRVKKATAKDKVVAECINFTKERLAKLQAKS